VIDFKEMHGDNMKFAV